MHARYINLSTRKSIDCRLLFCFENQTSVSTIPTVTPQNLSNHSNVSPSPDRSCDSTSHFPPAASLSAPCTKAPRKISRIRIFSLKIALPIKPCPSNSHSPKAIDAPQRTRERRTHPCTALEILQSLTTLNKPSRPTLTYRTCVLEFPRSNTG